MATRVVFVCLTVLLLATRLAHRELLWVEEAYPSAAAAELLAGKVLYRDIWFDKPPLYAALYALWGASPGVPLRIAGAMYVLLACFILWRFARSEWGLTEANWAASLLGLYLTFDIPSAVIALAPDLLMITPHVLAVSAAWQRRAFAAGIWSSVCLLVNAKALFVIAACLVFCVRQFPAFAVGVAIPQLALIGWLASVDALANYWQQVWWWGSKYSADTFLANPLGEGVKRTANWIGFHAPLMIGTVLYVAREKSATFAIWTGSSFLGVISGLRFFPRYYFQLLPAVCWAGARGIARGPKAFKLAVLVLLTIPIVRFGPRYLYLWRDQFRGVEHEWSDTAMMRDSAEIARRLKDRVRDGDNLLVWGYRPDVFVFSGLPAATRFLDSQPLTGVIADRHLTSSQATFGELAANLRQELKNYSPAFIVDGLGVLNPALAITMYSDLREWLENYEVVDRTKLSILYQLRRGRSDPISVPR